jgi:peptidoglycan/LPS O-acetylase OafA/YrhL
MAVLLVVLSHLANLNTHAIPLLDFRGTGKYGVYLFFALSAFLLTKPFVAPNAKLDDLRVWRRYSMRRVLRIFPLYWFVLAVNWFFTEVSPTRVFPTLPTDLWQQHMLMQAGKGPFWTIPVEFEYYLVIPFFALAVRALRGNIWAVTAFVAGAIAASSWLWPPSETPLNSLNLGYYLPVFLLGSYAAVLDDKFARTAAPKYEFLALGALGIVFLLFASVAGALLGEEVDKAWQHHNYIGFGALWSFVILAMLRSRQNGWLARLFSSVPLRVIGVVSFSTYLWHGPIVRAVLLLGLPNAFVNAWLVITASIALSMLSYVAIERPGLRGALARRLAG